MSLFVLKRQVAYTQAANCWACLHLGSLALYMGVGCGRYGHRLEVLTPFHWFRFSWGSKPR